MEKKMAAAKIIKIPFSMEKTHRLVDGKLIRIAPSKKPGILAGESLLGKIGYLLIAPIGAIAVIGSAIAPSQPDPEPTPTYRIQTTQELRTIQMLRDACNAAYGNCD